MKVRQYKDILLECLVTLRHARTFVTSREKMHPTGIELYDNLIVEIKEALDAPEPALPVSETSVTHAAQHEETGRMWWGPKDQIPKGYTDLGPEEDPESKSTVYTNEAKPHKPILPDRFNSTSTPETSVADTPYCRKCGGPHWVGQCAL